MAGKVWVEVGATGLAIQIFRSKKAAVLYAVSHEPEPNMREMPLALATGQVRGQVFQRDNYSCVLCGREVRWERGFPNSGEMDEKQARGDCQMNDDGVYSSGLVSVSNCQTLCKPCHTGPGTGKQDRSPSFTKSYGLSPVSAAQQAVNKANACLDFAKLYLEHNE